MESANKISYKFSKIPQKTVEQPVPMDLSSEITKMFEYSRARKQRISEYMCESIRKTKLRASKRTESSEYSTLPSRPTTSRDLLKFSDNSPITEMSRFQEMDIRKKIQARGFEKKYPQLLSDMMKETKQQFVKIVHYAGMNLKVKSCHPEAIFTIEPYKFVGKTNRYQEFLQIKKYFQNRWILHYPIVRNIHKECVLTLPYSLFNLNFQKVMTIGELEYAFKDKTQRASQFVYEFYLKISALVENEEAKEKKRINSRNYLEACTGLFSLHISKIIAHTILNIVNVTSYDSINPYLSLEVSFDDGLVLVPTAEEVIKCYHKFIDTVIETGTEIYVLQRNSMKGCENKYMRLYLTKEFIHECKENIKMNISKHYEPISNHLEDLNEKFDVIYTDINSEDFLESISDIKFEEGCKKINYYRKYLHKVMFIPDHEFFKIGRISLTNYREVLHEGLKENITSIFGKLCAQHFWEVNDLCENFEMIEIRANQKPVTTEELIETGKYMTWIKNEHLPELSLRVQGSLLSLCKIIDLGTLTDEHMELNSTAIKWLDKIIPIIDEHSTTFDTLKFDAEEKLQKLVEDVNDMIKDIYPLLVVLDDMDDISRAKNYLNGITLHMTKIKDIEIKIMWINKEEVSLSFPKSTYSEYEDLKNHIYPFYHLLKLCLEVQRNLSVWQDGPFEMLNYESTSSSVENFHKELTDLYKVYRKKLRQAQDDNVTLRFKGTVDDPDILNWPAPLKLCGTALKLIENFKPSVKVMRIICNPTLSKRHWKAMSEIAGKNVTPNAGTTLRNIMQIDFQSQLSEYEIISTGASKEKQLKDDLEQLKAQWYNIRFTITKQEDSNLDILTDLEEIEAVVDDHNIKVLNMRRSVFVEPHDTEVRAFYGQIQKIRSTIDYWNEAQTKLLKLFPIFSSEDIKVILPKESELFLKTLKIFKYYVSLISEELLVMKIVNTTDITQKIKECLTDSEIVNQGVTVYLEVLRQSFPRLYFLGNDEMSQIISNKDLKSIQFLNRLFPGIQRLHTKDSSVIGVANSDSEVLEFLESIQINQDSSMEKFCSSVEEQIKKSLKTQMVDCYETFKTVKLKKLLSLYCSQILEVISQTYWTEYIDSALELTHDIKLKMYQQKLENALKDKLVLSDDCLTNLERIKLRGLIVNDISNKNMVKTILASNQTSRCNFEWESYFKYYYNNESVNIKVLSSEILYAYEYQENSVSIVCTPLTERCIKTLLNAFFLHFNGMVRSFDGTCLSEIIKSLVRSFGGLHTITSCTRNTTATALNQLIIGSVLCGSWLCLENLHLIKRGVLSVISQELQAIQVAKKHNSNECYLGGNLLSFNSSIFVCACGNIDGSHNTPLPPNAKEIFRTVTMLEPNYEKLTEITLYSFGFHLAASLSKKISCFFDLLRDLMPNKSHYKYGIQELKQVLLECGKGKSTDRNEDETLITFNSIRKIITSAIEEDDKNVYDEILSGIFPHVHPTFQENAGKKKSLFQICEQKNIQTSEHFVHKVLEAYDSIIARKSVIFVGETYTGKTTVLKLCSEISTYMNENSVICHFINPNSLDYNSMYGYFNTSNQHWQDGIVTKLMKSFCENNNNQPWLVFDGMIYCSWIEHLYSLLDHNKKFQSDSGEVVMVPKSTSILFEVENLDSCSPSLISRNSIIYLDHQTVGWASLVKSWVNSCTSEWIQEFRNHILDLFCWIIPPCLEFISAHCNQLCSPNQLNLVKNMIVITQIILDEVDEIVNRKDEDSRNLPTWIQATIIQAGMLGLGAILDNTSKHKFDEFYKLLWKGQNENNPHPKTLEKLDVGIPHEGLIYDYYYIYKQRGNWKLYQDILKTEKIVESRYMNTFLVPTIDTLRCHSLLDKFVKKNENILFVGPSGSGKSILIEDALMNKVDKSKYEILQVNFNVNLQSHVLQRHILSKLNKIKTGVFIPQSGKNFISFIDNINLVSTNGFGNCLELLRQHSDHKIWYDFSYGNEILVSNINLISVMGLPEGSKTKLDPRLLRHFNIFAINELSEDTITRIYSNSLLHTWRKVGFPSDIANIVNQIIQATFSIYRKVKLCCRATLSRSHYVFNTSSFSKVILGCSMLRKEIYDCNKKIYLKLWAHEVMRVFGDRLTSLDSIWLQARIKEAIKVDFGESFDEHFESNGCLPNELIFSTINDCDNRNGKRYEEITDQKTLIEKFVEVLKVYNDCHEIKLEIILFQNALEKLLRITRVLSISPGNALLIGPCGSGRRNLTKLACFLYKYKLFEPVITQGYSHQDWNKEIKLVLKESGALEHQCVFLVTEEQLIDDTFLQNIDLLLQNGEVPDLYDMEERQEILELARLSAQGGNRNLEITSSAVFDFFNKRSKDNLHLIICLSSVGSLLRKRIRNYPNLIDCHVIWWDDWPDDSLQQIANTWTANLDLQPEIKQKVIDVFIYCHRDSQNNYKQMLDQCHTTIYVTPVSFTHLLKLFIELMTKKQNEMAVKKKLYLTGLAKLSYAARQISDMQRALAEYQPQLAEMTQKATDMTKQIALETIEVEKASALVRKDEEVASEQAIVAQNLKMECESELAQAIPILEDAISALNTLKPSDITLVKSMKNPPDAIKLVMAAVCVIKDVKPDRIPDPSTGRKTIDYWGPSKRILGDMNFLQTLKDFDKDHIKPEIMVKIRKEYLPHKDFKPHVVAKASSAAEGLCKWIIAMDMYDKVAKEVAPKKEKLEKAEREYAETMTILNQKKDEVKRIEEKLASLKELLDDATEKQLKLQREVDACNKKLGSAQGLIGSLSGEKIRWTKSVENLANQENLLPGNILISSAIIAYLPALDNKFRKDVIQKWHQHISTLVSCSEDFNIIKSLSSDAETETWVRNGLPHDEFCFQNGVIHNFSKLYSLFIDPEYIGEKWIRKVEKRNNLIVTKFTHDDYLEKLKSCIILGKPIMIHKIKETFPPCLNQLITKHQYIQNGNTFLILNNEHIEIDTNFKLYFVCNMSKPQFAPELCNNITLINFAITHDGMSQCLLKIVTEIEKPELKKKRKELHKKKMKNRADLLEHENNILTTLCESETDILEDQASIKILDQSKDLARIVREKQEDSKAIETVIEDFRNKYTSVSSYAANLYSCIKQIQKLNCIYQFSLEWYMNLYYKSIILSEKSRDFNKRCEKIKESFLYHLYQHTVHSLFRRDKLIFLFFLTLNVLKSNNTIDDEEIQFFIKIDQNSTDCNEYSFDSISKKVNELGCLTNFQEFLSKFDSISWRIYLEAPYLLDIPAPWNVTLSSFQKLILTKLLKPNYLYLHIQNFIAEVLGEKFTATPHYNITDTFNESYCLSPILFISTTEFNPSKSLSFLAEKKKVLHCFKTLTFGENETAKATLLMNEARVKGSWLLLQNCHLSTNWFELLEKNLTDMDFDNTHENFRLWLTCESVENIPLELLQNSIKVVVDSPKGFKQNLKRLYMNQPICEPEFFSGCPGKHAVFTKLLYGLASFHCALQCRVEFGEFGWKKPFIFDDSDFQVSLQQLQMVVNEEGFCLNNFEKIFYLIGSCHYGGYLEKRENISLVEILLMQFVNSEIGFNKNYLFNNLERYGLPKKCDHQDFLSYISKLPEKQNPEIYGMNEYNDALCNRKEAEHMLKTIFEASLVQRQQSIEANEFTLITTIEDVLTNIPKRLEYKTRDNYVIHQEKVKYNNLLHILTESLQSLKQAIGGAKFISPDEEGMAEDILKFTVPKLWLNVAFVHEKNLPNFISMLRKRVDFFQNLAVTEKCFPLSAFFSPQTLICKAKLDFSVACGDTVENVDFTFDVLKDKSDITVDGIVITELYLFGAKWDEDCGKILEAHSCVYNALPPILFSPVCKGVGENVNCYKCPVYQSVDMKDLITFIPLETSATKEHWIKRGVRIFCQI